VATIRFTETTSATPERFLASLTDFGPGRRESWRQSDEYLKVHEIGVDHADVTEGSGGIWERLRCDRSDPVEARDQSPLGWRGVAETCSPAGTPGASTSFRREEIMDTESIADIADIANAADATGPADRAAQTRRARFGKLPEHIPYAALIEETVATPKAVDGYSEERSWLHYSCVALDLGF
jgi:hypothetical protein